MFKNNLTLTFLILVFAVIGCSDKSIKISSSKLNVINREILSIDKNDDSISLDDKIGDGLVIIEDLDFETGTIELELKGEDIRGKSFVGIAFNIQNDSTYEAIYFRPFNFQAKEQISRDHSIQYVSHPKNTWRFLRTNFEGKYESEYPRKPSPAEWFGIRITISDIAVVVYDVEAEIELLVIERIEKQITNKIALWMGNNSKGEFRNLRIN